MASVRETRARNPKHVNRDGGGDTSSSLFETGEESLFDKSSCATPTIEHRHEGSANKRVARDNQEARKRRFTRDQKETLLLLKSTKKPSAVEENPQSFSWISKFEERLISANQIVITSLFGKFEEKYESLRKDVGVHHERIETLESGLKDNTEKWKNLSERVADLSGNQQINTDFRQPRAVCGKCGKNVNKNYLGKHQKTKSCKPSCQTIARKNTLNP